jgi:hypothetical protein
MARADDGRSALLRPRFLSSHTHLHATVASDPHESLVSGVQAKMGVTVAVKHKRRSDRQSRRRGGQLSKLEIVADEQTLTPFGRHRRRR